MQMIAFRFILKKDSTV